MTHQLQTHRKLLKFNIYIPFFLLNALWAHSQNQQEPGNNIPTNNRIRYSISLGSEFTTTKGYGSAFSTSITPSVSYKVSEKWHVGGGIRLDRISYFNVPSLYTSESSVSNSGNFSLATLIVNGHYQISDRLSIAGAAYKQIPVSGEPLIYNPFYPYTTNKSQGIDLNVGYRIGKSLYFEAGFRYSEGGSPGRTNPFYLNDPFYRNSLPGSFSTW